MVVDADAEAIILNDLESHIRIIPLINVPLMIFSVVGQIANAEIGSEFPEFRVAINLERHIRTVPSLRPHIIL